MAELKALPGKREPLDSNAAEVIAELRTLIDRVARGEVIGVFAAIVTETRDEDDDTEEDVEAFYAGIYTEPAQVRMQLDALSQEILEEWREDRDE